MRAPRICRFPPALASGATGLAAVLARLRELGFDHLLPGDCHNPAALGEPWPLRPHLQGITGIATLNGLVHAVREAGMAPLIELDVARVRPEAPVMAAYPERFHAALPHGPDPRPAAARTLMVRLDDGDIAAAWRRELAATIGELARAGAAGMLAREAHRAGPGFFAPLLAAIREQAPDFLAIADCLGEPPDMVAAVAAAGFDMVLDSCAWWDLWAPWYLEQHERFRQIAGIITSPVPPFAPGPAVLPPDADPEGPRRLALLRLALANLAGNGILVPAGFEYGTLLSPDDPALRPGDLEAARERAPFDLSAELAEMLRLRQRFPDFAARGPLRRASAPEAGAVALLRLSGESALTTDSALLGLFDPDPASAHGIDPGLVLRAAGGRIGKFHRLLPGNGEELPGPSGPPVLPPLGWSLWRGEAEVHKPRQRSRRDEQASRKRLFALAETRVAIERVTPELDGGRFPVKRAVGDVLRVEADIFCDGHDQIAACLMIRAVDEPDWQEVPMAPLVNDRWVAEVPLTRNIRYFYTIAAWRDLWASWCEEVVKKHRAGQPIDLELIEGRQLLARACTLLTGADRERLEAMLRQIDDLTGEPGELLAVMLDPGLRALLTQRGPRTNLSHYSRELEVRVDRTAAVFSAWYEMFPRSQSGDPHRHGTFDDVIRHLPYVRDLGFDVLYFPPIHPIGRTHRKGRNNSLKALPGDPGSPYAIGSDQGGHTAIHPELGTFDDFRRLVEAAHAHGLEIALDFAIQCSPDHPWIREHPEWFDWRPDGTIKYAENPPKKYEDIVPVHFYREALPSIWYELRDVLLFWINHGVKIFRVDNPHTKPFPFWEWVILEVLERHPDVIFLSEAFTRPKIMKRLAKLGFQQSYTYFTWRNTKQELIEYLIELTQDEPKDYMRPNFFVNTPDINPFYLQTGGRPAFRVRALLAATLSPAWGMYNGFELCEARAMPGREEYLDSEKYEIRAWDWDRPGHIRDDIARFNRLRRAHPALWSLTGLEFYNAWNDNILYYGRMTADLKDFLLFAVNLDPHHAHGCLFEVPLWKFGLPDDASVGVEDLVHGTRFVWHGKIQHLWLDPQVQPYAIWRLLPPGQS